ncbi:MAG: UDP-N-acetylmuramoyl-tripeptide--D-alanyl-D-alanine ligase [Lachnospiraceae bacterium]|nr:UDP-N-acetylmuramoyl-tripeptide--D-alanyl-D-alanine ligase [Lachnospiraceae bacterium]
MFISMEDVIKYTGGELMYGKLPDNREKSGVTSVGSDSQKIAEGGLFVAIEGERVDGHRFVKSAFENGAAAAIVSKAIPEEDVPAGKFCIKVNDTVAALQRLAAWYRRKFDIPVVAVSGSVGKTTTKEMIAAALSSGMNVLKTEGNMNSQLGVALMMFRLTPEHDIAVIEMGISESGEMHRLSEIAAPDAAVLTNIGVSHIGQLGSRENIRREKLDIVRGFRKRNGIILIPSNDEMLNMPDAMTEDALNKEAYEIINDLTIVRYGEDDGCRYRAYDIHNGQDGVVYDIRLADGTAGQVSLSVLGMHNVYNSLAAIAVADYFGLAIKPAVKKLEQYKPIAMRGQIFENAGITIIDDTYNASPDSMKSGLSVLWEKQCSGRKVVVLADILELGDMSEQIHRSIGAYIADRYNSGVQTDMLFTVGKEAAFIADEAAADIKNADTIENIIIQSFGGRDELTDYIMRILKPGDMVMVKGSRGMHMDKLCEALKNM